MELDLLIGKFDIFTYNFFGSHRFAGSLRMYMRIFSCKNRIEYLVNEYISFNSIICYEPRSNQKFVWETDAEAKCFQFDSDKSCESGAIKSWRSSISRWFPIWSDQSKPIVPFRLHYIGRRRLCGECRWQQTKSEHQLHYFGWPFIEFTTNRLYRIGRKRFHIE